MAQAHIYIKRLCDRMRCVAAGRREFFCLVIVAQEAMIVYKEYIGIRTGGPDEH
jgi:hypothetical protein